MVALLHVPAPEPWALKAMSGEAAALGDKVSDAIKRAKLADRCDSEELCQQFSRRITDRARTYSNRVSAARLLCEEFNHYDGARRMRACNACVSAVRIAMVFDVDDEAESPIAPKGTT